SEKGEPLVYLHGVGNLISGMEDAIKGKKVGDKFNVTIAPKDGYGETNKNLIKTVARSEFEGIDKIEVGMRLRMSGKTRSRMVRIVAIDGDNITIDGNHELAGKTLHFAVHVRDLRDATDEEIAHGHVHGPGGHHHH